MQSAGLHIERQVQYSMAGQGPMEVSREELMASGIKEGNPDKVRAALDRGVRPLDIYRSRDNPNATARSFFQLLIVTHTDEIDVPGTLVREDPARSQCAELVIGALQGEEAYQDEPSDEFRPVDAIVWAKNAILVKAALRAGLDLARPNRDGVSPFGRACRYLTHSAALSMLSFLDILVLPHGYPCSYYDMVYLTRSIAGADRVTNDDVDLTLRLIDSGADAPQQGRDSSELVAELLRCRMFGCLLALLDSPRFVYNGHTPLMVLCTDPELYGDTPPLTSYVAALLSRGLSPTEEARAPILGRSFQSWCRRLNWGYQLSVVNQWIAGTHPIQITAMRVAAAAGQHMPSELAFIVRDFFATTPERRAHDRDRR